jgi:hypothetical protein
MFKSWMRDFALAIRARTGMTAGVFVWMAVAVFAGLTAFVFLCVAAYVWASLQIGPVFAGLAMGGVFILIGLIGLIVSGMLRRRARERAILERAARAQSSSSWLLDPKLLGAAMQAGRTFGWQRIVPVALLGLIAVQWLRARNSPDDSGDQPT